MQAGVSAYPAVRISWYEGVGHLPLWEAPDRFNAELADFASACQG